MNTSWFMDTDRTRLHGRKQVETTPEEFYGNLKWSISKTRKSQYTFESLRRDGSTNWNSSKIKKWIRSFNSRFESAIIYQIYSPPSPTFSSLSTIAIKFPSKMTVGKSRHISLERRFCHEFDRCWLWCWDQWRLKCWHQRWIWLWGRWWAWCWRTWWCGDTDGVIPPFPLSRLIVFFYFWCGGRLVVVNCLLGVQRSVVEKLDILLQPEHRLLSSAQTVGEVHLLDGWAGAEG